MALNVERVRLTAWCVIYYVSYYFIHQIVLLRL